MLGQALESLLTARHLAQPLRHAQADVADPESLRAALTPFGPDVIINCAAATDVDRCETDPEWAYRVNADGARNVAAIAAELGARLIHLSTDFVFSGEADAPYPEEAPTAPINVYGASKLAGEEAVLERLPGTLVVRTQWLYGPAGGNFAALMLRLASRRPPGGLRVVDDQTGAPTYTPHLARKLIWLAEQPAERFAGRLHVNNAGSATRREWAAEVLRAAGWQGVAVHPASSAEFPTPARRPRYSVLRRGVLERAGADDMPPWPAGVVEYIRVLATDNESRSLLNLCVRPGATSGAKQ